MPSKKPLLLLLLITAFLSTVVALKIQMSHPMPGYRADTIEWATTGRVVDTFTPLAYPLFAGPAYRIAGDRGILALQVILELVLAGVCYLLLRELGMPVKWSAYGSLPVVLFPDLLLSVSKQWDLTLSTVLLLFFVFICLRIAHSVPSPSLGLTATSGLLFAAAIFCRPNLIFLLPIILFLLLSRRTSLSATARTSHIVIFLALAVAGFSLLGVASHGAFYFPSNGPYNLYAGHNPQTRAALLDHLNGEFSLAPDFYASHPNEPLPDFHSAEMPDTFTRWSIQFASHHPEQELGLFAIKLFTFFRPDTKLHSLFSASGLIKSFLALPVILFLVTLLRPGRAPLSFDDRLLFVFEICYVLPFLLTNSDPRFRTPLDALLLLHLVSLLYRRHTFRLTLAS
jgi:hypothetical protein